MWAKVFLKFNSMIKDKTEGVYCFPAWGSHTDTCCGTKFEKPKNNTIV